MKNILTFISLFLVSYSLASQVLKSPESIVFDSANNRYLVSNANNGKDGGSIVALDPETQEITNFIDSGVNSPKGLTIVNDILYCSDVKYVKGFNLTDGSQVYNFFVPNSSFLNDVASDGINLYISDNAVDKIFEVSLLSAQVSVLNTGKNLHKPNGLFYNEFNNSLLICAYRSNAVIQSFNLSLNTLSLVCQTNLDYLDGLTQDADGNYYVSSWGANAVYIFDPDFSNEPIEVSNGHYSPADIFVNKEDNLLLVPNFGLNTIDFIPLGEKESDLNFNPHGLKIYPNPNHGHFTISYKMEEDAPVSIYILSKSGKILHVIKREFGNTDSQEIKIDLNSFGIPNGIFFIKFIFGDDVYMKRIVAIE